MADIRDKVIREANDNLKRTIERQTVALSELDFSVNTGDFKKAEQIRRDLLLLAACKHVYELTVAGRFHAAARAYKQYEVTFKDEFILHDHE